MILQATSKELNESIEQLKTYRDRLREEIITMSQKLRLAQSSIEQTLIVERVKGMPNSSAA